MRRVERRGAGGRGFTLIEILVVMAIVALLLTISLPNYFGSVDRAKDAVLRENLSVLRTMIDKFYADKGRYPEHIGELVEYRYLREIPTDPMTQSRETWIVLERQVGGRSEVFDVRSGAVGQASDGTPLQAL